MSATAMSTLGIVHTLISLAAVGAGLRALIRYKAIGPDTGAGALYIAMTILTCVTGFFIFAHGGFGKPHALGIITLLTLGVAGIAGFTRLFGRASAAVETVAYSLTFFFHMIPMVTETSTRLPASAPLLDSADAPELQAVSGLLFLVFVVGAVMQVRRVRAQAVNPLGASVRTV